jgi:putative ABC transport system permease protein
VAAGRNGPVTGRLLRLLALRPLRRRPLRAVLAIAAVAAGTSMAVSVFVVRASVDQSVRGFGRELAGPTELRVVGAIRRGGLVPGVVDEVEATDGVAAAVPVVQAVTLIESGAERGSGVDGPGRHHEEPAVAFGIDCRAETLAGDFGCTDEMVADHGDRPLAVGPGLPDDARLLTNVGSVSLAGLPVFDGLRELGGVSFAVFPMASAQRVFARGDRVDAIYVQPEPGVDVQALQRRLEDVVGPQNAVLTADEGPPEVESQLAGVLPMFTLLAIFGLATGGMLVYNTVTLSLEERRRELAVVGALGGTTRVLVSTTLAEAGLLGAVGGVVGAAAGVVVARPIVDSLSVFTERIAGIPIAMHLGVRSLIVGAALGVVVAVLAAVLPVRRARRIDVAGELSGRGLRVEASASHLFRQSLVWAAVLGVGLLMTWVGQRNGGLDRWQVPAGALGFAAAAIGMLFCGARLSPLAIRPLARVLPRTAVSSMALANLGRAPGRTGVMVIAVSAAITTAFVTAGYVHSVQVDIYDATLDNMDGVEVTSVEQGANVNLDAGLSESVLGALAEVPGVGEVHRGAVVLAGGHVGDLVGVTAYDDPWILDNDGDEMLRGRIDADAFMKGEAIINTTLARDKGLRPGDMLELPTPTGMVSLPVQAVISQGGATGRYVQIPFDLHEQWYGRQPSRGVFVEPKKGVGILALARNIRAADLGEEVRVRTPVEVANGTNRAVARQMVPFWSLQRGLLAVSFVASCRRCCWSACSGAGRWGCSRPSAWSPPPCGGWCWPRRGSWVCWPSASAPSPA